MADMRKGMSKGNITADERMAQMMADADPEMTVPQAYQIIKKGQGSRGTQLERYAENLMRENPEMEFSDAMQQSVADLSRGSKGEREAKLLSKESGKGYKESLDTVNKRIERTSSQKEHEEVEEAKNSLDAMFEEEGGFLNADISDPKVRSRVGRTVSRIERDFPMSSADRKMVTEIRQLASLGEIVSEELTDAETGPLDTMFRSVKKYTSNDVKGLKGVAAYEAYRNSMRRALAGTAQSVQETANFNKTMGSLLQQTGPVLEQFRTQTIELRAKLESIYESNDEYVAKYRLNMSLDQLGKVINQLDDRMDMFDNVKVTDESELITSKTGLPAKDLDGKPVKKNVSEYFKK